MPFDRMSYSAKVALALSYTLSLVLGQNTLSVSVGSFYNPNIIAAHQGDIVEFTFTFGRHGVTQSTADNPCVQAPGGFNSGLISGFAANDTFSSPTWSFTVTNASQPIYFYCQAMVPAFHCSSGMVGAVNAPDDQFNSFSAAAKALTTTPGQTTSAVLSGIGATAVALPTTIINSAALASTTSIPTSSTSSTGSTSSLPAETSAAPTTKSANNTGAIVGGAVGGSVAVAIIALLIFLLLKQRGSQKQAPSLYSADASQRGGYDTMNTKPFIAPQGTGGSEGNPYAGNMIPTMPFDPAVMVHLRNQGSMPTMASMPGMQHTAQTHSAANIPSDINRNTTYTASSAFSADPTYVEPPSTSGQNFLPLNSPTPTDANRSTSYTTDTSPSGVTTLHYVPPVPPLSPPLLAQVASEKAPAPNMDVKEIAKEVAHLLAPHLQGAAAVATGASGQETPASQKRPLPNPFPKTYEDDMPQARSPGPPQYERFNS